MTKPTGGKQELYFAPGQDREKVINDVQLSRYQEYCEENWLDDSVSWFLSGCADILLESQADDVLSTYRISSVASREVPVSSCVSEVQMEMTGRGKYDITGNKTGTQHLDFHRAESIKFEQMMEDYDRKAKRGERSGRKKQNKCSPSRFYKLQSLREKHPNAVFSFERVDTDGAFSSGGTYYRLPPDAPGYKAKSVGDDTQYDMDKIVVVTEIAQRGESTFFYNWDAEEVFPHPA